MKRSVNQIYDELLEKVNTIYDIFKNFFGEEHVDLQHRLTKVGIACKMHKSIGNDAAIYDISEGMYKEVIDFFKDMDACIYVWWPSVTVTNENNKSINIQDLYAKVTMTLEGIIPYENPGFELNRATYSSEQFYSDYMHSHIQGIPKHDLSKFLSPCLGRGPIRETIGSLKNDYDEVLWMLFCQELSMYVTVESLHGVPWRYLEKIGRDSLLHSHTAINNVNNLYSFRSIFTKDKLKEFIEYYLKNGNLALNYKDGLFTLGMSYYNYIIDVSNSFISFYNTVLRKDNLDLSILYRNSLLLKVIVKNRKFYTNSNTHNAPVNYSEYTGKHVLSFKGKNITLAIHESSQSEATLTNIIDNNVASYIINNILKVINFRYINEHSNNSRGTEKDSSSYKRVIYI